MHKPLLKYFLSFTLLCAVAAPAQNQNRIDSLLKALAVAKEDSNKVELYINLTTQLKRDHADSAMRLALAAYDLAKELELPIKEARAMQAIGNVLLAQRQYQKAVKKLLETVPIYEKFKLKKDKAGVLVNIASCYRSLSDYVKAQEINFLALKLYEELGDDEGQALVLGNIGISHMANNELDKALEYGQKALAKDRTINNVAGIGRHLGNIATIYQHQAALLMTTDTVAANEKFRKSKEAFEESISIAKKGNDKTQLAIITDNLANLYFAMGDTAKCLENYNKAIELDKESGNKEGMATHLGNIGWIYFISGKNKEAEKYTVEAVALMAQTSNIAFLLNFKENLSDIYEKSGKLALSLEAFRSAVHLRDSLFNLDNAKKQLEAEMNFEFDKKEALAKEESEKQALIRNLLLAGFGCVLIMALIIFRSYRNKKKANEIISKQKAEVEHQKTELEIKNKEITDSIHYAKRIQKSLMPNEKYIERILKDRFN